jgi:hypothetical protein
VSRGAKRLGFEMIIGLDLEEGGLKDKRGEIRHAEEVNLDLHCSSTVL